MRFGEPVHVYNNYYFHNTDVGVACQADAGCMVERNYFELDDPNGVKSAVMSGAGVGRIGL